MGEIFRQRSRWSLGDGVALAVVLVFNVFNTEDATARLARCRLKGKVRFTALMLPLVLVVTATHHLGYPQYRQDGLRRPETGNMVISSPTFATANPVGSKVAPPRSRTPTSRGSQPAGD